MARIKVIKKEEAKGKLKEIYNNLEKSRGKLANVHMIQSLRPKSITKHMDLYMELMYSRSELSRAERELIGTVVSIANGCYYCSIHHSEALKHFWKDNEKIKKLLNKNYDDILNPKELKIVKFAEHLTKYPGEHQKKDFTKALNEHGISDDGILDIVLITSYFNFVNRIVLSLDVELENDNAKGYKFDF